LNQLLDKIQLQGENMKLNTMPLNHNVICNMTLAWKFLFTLNFLLVQW